MAVCRLACNSSTIGNPNGLFEVLSFIIVQVKDQSQYLNCITQELIDSGRDLRDIDDKKVDCLRAFVEHKKFADWLKKSLRGMTFYIDINCYKAAMLDPLNL